MFRASEAVIDAMVERLLTNYRKFFAHLEPDFSPIIEATARLSLDRISGTDALYHDMLHTIAVVDVGQAILRGRCIAEPLSPDDWLHFTSATLLHDVGYLRGICPGDHEGSYVISADGRRIDSPRGCTDAFLSPWHVDRAQIFVRHRFSSRPYMDQDRLCAAIEMTRFPPRLESNEQENGSEAGLVRAADLIGQLADPDYSRKLTGLFHEFQEIGIAEKLGYKDAADVAEFYPQFFWKSVEPYIGPALEHLQRTAGGRMWIAHLYANVFIEERLRPRLGPGR